MGSFAKMPSAPNLNSNVIKPSGLNLIPGTMSRVAPQPTLGMMGQQPKQQQLAGALMRPNQSALRTAANMNASPVNSTFGSPMASVMPAQIPNEMPAMQQPAMQQPMQAMAFQPMSNIQNPSNLQALAAMQPQQPNAMKLYDEGLGTNPLLKAQANTRQSMG